MSNRFRDFLVGIFVIAGVVIFIILYTWLTGRISMRNTYDIKVYFDDVSGLKIGDPVLVFGLEKGKVRSFKIENDKVLAILSLDRKIHLPEDSKIAIRSVSYMGADRYVKITLGKSDKTSTVFSGINETLDLEALVLQFDSLAQVFKTFKPPDLEKTVNRLFKEVDRNMKLLAVTLKGPTEKLDILMVRLDSLSTLLKGEGTVAKLLKSDELYNEVKKTNTALRELLEDIKAHPKKYLQIKVF
ncbi:hypothetical protein BXT86_06480 [candidate division WOR-3 bacterium 4484_100]|uniref:Mce/MlaD domain-containing protein n=1 Tax=candidate division WOR-3 bacterium 4484_100 TaxID=1936077 RepID=A0A1V4QEL8_UNCW3|nr:MAG: hypothetical protein BXT86_06480 [candidate division WOR-3 bacterium 4484_100]